MCIKSIDMRYDRYSPVKCTTIKSNRWAANIFDEFPLEKIKLKTFGKNIFMKLPYLNSCNRDKSIDNNWSCQT